MMLWNFYLMAGNVNSFRVLADCYGPVGLAKLRDCLTAGGYLNRATQRSILARAVPLCLP